MIISGETKTEKIIIVNCNCGCNEGIYITKHKDIDFSDDYYLSIVASKFYSQQMGLFKTLCNRIKMIWYIISGKNYRLCEIVLKEKDIDNLINKLQNIKEK